MSKKKSSTTEVTKMDNEGIELNGKKYVLASSIRATKQRESLAAKKYVIVRTYSAGVFAGRLKSRVGQEVTLQDARRIYWWEGAASLSQLAIDGTSLPDKCKFPAAVDEILLLQAIEIIPCTDKARVSIEAVKEWKL